jgi:hypothetical protein
MKSLFTLTFLCAAVSSAFAQSDSIGVQVDPTSCELNLKTKVPSCTFTVTATKGSVIETAYKSQNQTSSYVDVQLIDENFVEDADFTTTPPKARFNEDGKKQVRLIYTGSREEQKGEKFGRFYVNIAKDGSMPVGFLVPVYIGTGSEKSDVQEIKLSTETFSDGKRSVTLPVARITNNGDAVFAASHVSFVQKDNFDVNVFKQFNATVLPHSTAVIRLTDPKLAEAFKAAYGTVYLRDKRSTRIVGVKVTR